MCDGRSKVWTEKPKIMQLNEVSYHILCVFALSTSNLKSKPCDDN